MWDTAGMAAPTHRRLMILAAVLAVTAAACGGGEQSIADFSEIAEGDPVMTADASGTSAVLTVSTSLDAVCAVAYGETEALGGLATDQDMGAGGHSDHSARLTGLSPDTRYFYRLQAVGADGRLYQRALFEFRTPIAPDVATPGRNVAVGAIVLEFSSEFSSAFAAANAVDGDLATEWSSAGDGDDAYVVIDLGRATDVVAVGFQTRSMGDGSATTTTFTVTVDGGETFGPFAAGIGAVEFSGQVIRFDVDSSTGGNTGAAELEVYERP